MPVFGRSAPEGSPSNGDSRSELVWEPGLFSGGGRDLGGADSRALPVFFGVGGPKPQQLGLKPEIFADRFEANEGR